MMLSKIGKGRATPGVLISLNTVQTRTGLLDFVPRDQNRKKLVSTDNRSCVIFVNCLAWFPYKCFVTSKVNNGSEGWVSGRGDGGKGSGAFKTLDNPLINGDHDQSAVASAVLSQGNGGQGSATTICAHVCSLLHIMRHRFDFLIRMSFFFLPALDGGCGGGWARMMRTSSWNARSTL